MTTMKISDDLAAELHMRDDGSSVGEWRQVGKQLIRTSRWTEHFWLVVTNGSGLWGVEYEVGLTEDQECRYPWEEGSGEEIELTPLVGVPVTSTRYLTEREYEKHLAKEARDG
jgi:hypothetical protein